MNVIKTSIDGVVIIEPRLFKDARGYFFESFIRKSLKKRCAILHLCRTMRANLLMVSFVVFTFKSRLLLKVN